MKIKLVFHTVGRVLLLEAALMLLPLAVSLIYGEKLLAFFCDIGCCGCRCGGRPQVFLPQ